MARDQRVTKAVSGGGESAADARIHAARVGHAFPWQQVVRRHSLRAQHQGKPLFVVDVLQDGHDDLAGQLEELLLAVTRATADQFTSDDVVEANPHRVCDRQTGLLVHSDIT